MEVKGFEVEGVIKVDNVRIYGLNESVIASGYPLKANLGDFDKEFENLKKCMDYDIDKIIEILNNKDNNTRCFSINEELNCVNMTVGNLDKNILISFEDLIKVSEKGWTFNASRGYVQSTNRPYIELQRYLLGEEGFVVDHINKDKLDNRRSNLRLVTHSQNTHNRDILKENSSGVIGVFFSVSKNRWIASITIDKKTITRNFKDKESAIKKRLELENDLLGEFSPQKHLFDLYGIEKSWNTKNETLLDFVSAIKHYKRVKHLGNAVPGSGHDCFAKGITVQFDLQVPEYIWRQLDRYHFIDYVSSQSKMHRILKMDIDKACNKYVDIRTIQIVNDYIEAYNNFDEEKAKRKELILRGDIARYTKEDLFNCIVANTPCGLMLTARMTTNYLQLKSIVNQRSNHKMQEWRLLCDYFKTLPMFDMVCK